MIETFLIFSLFMPFVEVLLHTALDILRQVDPTPKCDGKESRKFIDVQDL